MAIEIKMRIELDPDSDKNAEIFIQLQSPNFSGQSSAWLKLPYFKHFIENLSRCPIDPHLIPVIAGGFRNATGNQIVQEHIHISATPTGNTGNISLCVKLGVPDDGTDELKLKFFILAYIDTNYYELSEFAKVLSMLYSGSTKEIVFQFNDN